MISRTPHPGHRGVPSVSGRAHFGQLKTCASGSPIAPMCGSFGRADSRHFLRLMAIGWSVERSGPVHIRPDGPGSGRTFGVWSGEVGDTEGMRLELTKQGDYAVRAMLVLAAPDGDTWISVARISAEMAIPERVLPRVMRDLGAAGLVEARTGRSGGYRLARPAGEITLLDVIIAAEPNDDERRCVLRGIPCGRDGRCAVHDAFGEAREALLDRLAGTTVAEVAAPRRR
jgi:Rrf2 family iron-sulfur cluster assembly transcriptional regulator